MSSKQEPANKSSKNEDPSPEIIKLRIKCA